MTVAAIRDALKTAIANISGMKAVYDTAPESIGTTPAAIIIVKDSPYDLTLANGFFKLNLEVVVLVAPGGSNNEDQNVLDGLIASSGAGSIKAAVEGASLGSNGSYCRVSRVFDYGGMSYNGQPYIGCRFAVEAVI